MAQSLDWDPLNSSQVFSELFINMAKHPEKVMHANLDLWKQGLECYQQNLQFMLGWDQGGEQVVPNTDRRFRHESWTDQPGYQAIRQSYQLITEYVQRLVRETEGLDEKTAKRAEFYTQLILDAMSPSNFMGSNPEVIDKMIATRGQSVIDGLTNLKNDLERGDGTLKISMTDYDAFEVGKNIATTPGKVVYENRMMQLIQYQAATKSVASAPLLVVPPWINKFYIMDLQKKNSLINWLVEQGHTVFVISWINPDESYADVGFEEYVKEGVVEAISAIEKATGEKSVNAVGYCIGGTLLATTMAYMTAKKDVRIDSATFLTTMLDFEAPGELGIFIDDAQISSLEDKMDEKGFLDGKDMSGTFNLLRANDLIWSFYINNYLLGNKPRAFDLLYWNSDSTRMPAKMHKWYLRNLYLDNNLVEPGSLSIDGVPIDLTSIKIPSIFVSTEEDHIAPWTSTWTGALNFSGPVKFILGGSGHIAGICNPPVNNKYGFRVSSQKLTRDAQAWKEKAELNEGSWWPTWQDWVKKFQGKTIDARVPGDHELKVIEDAPGRYVKMK
jgi:polyhydroxyalkanoate synthase